MCGVGYRLETSNVAEDSGNGLVTAAGAGAQEEQNGALLVHETPQNPGLVGSRGHWGCMCESSRHSQNYLGSKIPGKERTSY